MEQEQEQGKEISLKTIIDIIKRHYIFELVIVSVAILAGVIFSFVNQEQWVASVRISVKANLTQNISYNDTSLSKIVMPTIKDFFNGESDVIPKASQKCGKTIRQNRITVFSEEESLIMTVSYTDNNKEDAVEKLKAIVEAAQEVVKEPSANSDETAQKAKANLKSKMDEIISKQSELDKNSEEYKYLKELYQAAQEVYNYIETDSAMSKYFFATIELEPVQAEPSVVRKDNDIRLILIFAASGIVLALLASVLIYVLSDRVDSEETVEQTTGKKNMICVLGKRPKKNAPKDLQLLNVNQLADALIFTKEQQKTVAYQIQSTTQGEGKSTITANLGLTLAAAGRRTLIIDCDFNKRKIHRLFKLNNYVGITEFFKDEKTFDEIINHTETEGLDVITAAGAVGNHTTILTSEKFSSLIGEAKSKYEFVLLDCGPVGLISDYINISKHVDGTLLVVACNYVKVTALKRAVKELESCSANIVGTVLNFSSQKDLHGYYYQQQSFEE